MLLVTKPEPAKRQRCNQPRGRDKLIYHKGRTRQQRQHKLQHPTVLRG